MAFYRIDVNVVATLYVRADDEEQAVERAVEYAGTQSCPEGDDLLDDYDARSEHVIISPAFTFYGRGEGSEPELLEDNEQEGLASYLD